jgi:hypothetical protein
LCIWKSLGKYSDKSVGKKNENFVFFNSEKINVYSNLVEYLRSSGELVNILIELNKNSFTLRELECFCYGSDHFFPAPTKERANVRVDSVRKSSIGCRSPLVRRKQPFVSHEESGKGPHQSYMVASHGLHAVQEKCISAL